MFYLIIKLTLVGLVILVIYLAYRLNKRNKLPLSIGYHDPPFDRASNLKKWGASKTGQREIPPRSTQFDAYIATMGNKTQEMEKVCDGTNYIKCNTIKNYLSDAQMAVCGGDWKAASLLLDASAIKMAEIQLSVYT